MVMNKKMLAMVSLGFLVVIILVIVIFKPDPPAESAASVLPTRHVEAADAISAELADCLLEAGKNFIKHSSDAGPIRMPGGSNVVLRANLAATYAWIVCESDYKLSR